MKRILPIIISLLPLLTFGQSMKIAPKQIEPGLNGQTIITRSGVNVLDSLKWTDVSGVPGNLERTSNKVTNFNSPNNTTYPTTQAVANYTPLLQSTFNNAINTTSYGSTTDANNIKNNSIISCNNAVLNIPTIGVMGGILTTNFGNSGNNGTQLFTTWDNQVWSRGYNGMSGWGAWMQMASRDWVGLQGFLNSIPTLQAVTTSGNSSTIDIKRTGGTGGSTSALDALGASFNTVLNGINQYARDLRMLDNSGNVLGAVGFFGTGQALGYGYLSSSPNRHLQADLKFTNGKVGINIPSINSPNYNLDVRGNAAIVGVNTSTADILNINSGTPGLSFSISNNSGGAGFLTRLTSTTNSTVGGIVENTYNPHSNAGFSSGGYIHGIADSTGSGPLTSGNHTQWRNGLNSIMTLGYDGSLTLPKLAGTGNRMVIANSGGAISTQAIPSLTETDPIYTADKPSIYRQMGALSNASDLNTYTSPGGWSASASTSPTLLNLPSEYTSGPLTLYNAGPTGAVRQTLNSQNTGFTGVRQVWTRTGLGVGGVWSAWVKYIFEGDNISLLTNDVNYYKPSDTSTILATKPDLNNQTLQKVTDRDSTTSHQIAAKGIWLTDSVGDNHGGYHAAVIIERTVNAATGNLPSHGVRDQTTMKGDNSNGYASFDFRPQISDSLAHATALQFYPYIYSGTHVGDLEGMDVNLWHWNPSAWTAGQVGTYTGLRIESANVTPLGGRYNVVDTSYGVRIQGRSVDGLGSTNPYSLWSVGSDKLFNMGNVAFGTYPKDDGIKLKVKGVTSLDGTVTSSSLSGTGTRMMVADAGGTMGTQSIPTVNNATLTLTTTIYGATNTQTWTSNSATNKNWAVNVAGTDITTGLNVHTGVLTTQSSTGNDDSVQLLSKINDKGYLQPTTGTGVNTGGGFAATAQTEAFNSTYIDLNDGTYTLYIVAGGNPSGGDIKLVDPNEIPDRIIRIVNTSGTTGTFINAPIVGLTSSSVTTINSGKYIVIQSVIDPSSGGRMWAQVGGNY